MNEESGQTVTDGWWCLNHEFFEGDDQIDTTVDTCVACGCWGADHLPVEVVAK